MYNYIKNFNNINNYYYLLMISMIEYLNTFNLTYKKITSPESIDGYYVIGHKEE